MSKDKVVDLERLCEEKPRISILCNSNGTLYNDILVDNAEDFELRYAEHKALQGIKDNEGLNEKYTRIKSELKKTKDSIETDRLKRDYDNILQIYLEIQDTILRDGLYSNKPMPGLENFLKTAKEHGISIDIFANATREYLEAVNERSGLREFFGDIYSTTDPQLAGERYACEKDAASFTKIKEDMKIKGKEPIAYLSHKEGEALAGAKSYGFGILIDDKREEGIIEAKEGKLIVANQLDSPYLNSILENYAKR